MSTLIFLLGLAMGVCLGWVLARLQARRQRNGLRSWVPAQRKEGRP